jgi:hypothetical protein
MTDYLTHRLFCYDASADRYKLKAPNFVGRYEVIGYAEVENGTRFPYFQVKQKLRKALEESDKVKELVMFPDQENRIKRAKEEVKASE